MNAMTGNLDVFLNDISDRLGQSAIDLSPITLTQWGKNTLPKEYET